MDRWARREAGLDQIEDRILAILAKVRAKVRIIVQPWSDCAALLLQLVEGAIQLALRKARFEHARVHVRIAVLPIECVAEVSTSVGVLDKIQARLLKVC